MTSLSCRTRRDRCPGVLRPWPADDGLLVRLRLVGGRISAASLRSLSDVAITYGDGRIHVTVRANVQVRGLPGVDAELAPEAHAALEDTGLLPSRTHELVRNIMVSPQTGLAGGRADLRPVADELDRQLLEHDRLADLPGRFLFVLDDGRGDLLERTCDLGLVALDPHVAQLRIGDQWGPTVQLADAPAALAALAEKFLDVRGSGPDAPWHVSELSTLLVPPTTADSRVPHPIAALPHGEVPAGRHVAVPRTGLDDVAARSLTDEAFELIVTPWRGILVPQVIHD